MAGKRVTEILERMDAHYGTDFRCSLDHENAWQLLIATMLSAQCTDARVNIVTKDLFVKYPSVEAFAAADLKELEQDIHSTGFYHNKAKNIIACCRDLMEKYNGEVPSGIDELTSLAGVGRKTANVIQSVVFKKAAMAVDTHVFRVSHRIGLVPDSCTTPFSVEKELVKNIPEKLIPIAHHWLILHGRYVCQARTPKCDTCGLQMMCKYFCNTYKVTKEEPKAKNK